MYTHENDGAYGCQMELESRLSNRLHNGQVAKQGEIDTTVRFSINGKIRYIPAESKVNGGRVDTLLNGSNKAHYVLYTLRIQNSTTQNLLRYVPTVIIPTDLFCAKLREFGALKEVRHNGKVDGIAIQPSNKAWFVWLSEYPMVYDKSKVWYADDFVGLV